MAGAVVRVSRGWCSALLQHLRFQDAARLAQEVFEEQKGWVISGRCNRDLCRPSWFNERVLEEMVLLELRLDVCLERVVGRPKPLR